MGADDDPAAVLDPQCRVRGVDGLWVVDGSILPAITSRGPHATIVMIGHRAAEFITSEVRQPGERPPRARVAATTPSITGTPSSVAQRPGETATIAAQPNTIERHAVVYEGVAATVADIDVTIGERAGDERARRAWPPCVDAEHRDVEHGPCLPQDRVSPSSASHVCVRERRADATVVQVLATRTGLSPPGSTVPKYARAVAERVAPAVAPRPSTQLSAARMPSLEQSR